MGDGIELDLENPVLALCAAGMAVGGDAAAATDFFLRAWAGRADDFEAAVAAHYVARVQTTAAEKLAWDTRAASHAEAALAMEDSRVGILLASLYLNLGDGLLAAGRCEEARVAAERAEAALVELPDDGYRAFVAGAIARLREHVAAAIHSVCLHE